MKCYIVSCSNEILWLKSVTSLVPKTNKQTNKQTKQQQKQRKIKHPSTEKRFVYFPSHYLNYCWNVVDSKLMNKIRWNLKRNSYIFIGKKHLKMSCAKRRQFLSRPQCVKCIIRHDIITMYSTIELPSLRTHPISNKSKDSIYRAGELGVYPGKKS